MNPFFRSLFELHARKSSSLSIFLRPKIEDIVQLIAIPGYQYINFFQQSYLKNQNFSRTRLEFDRLAR